MLCFNRRGFSLQQSWWLCKGPATAMFNVFLGLAILLCRGLHELLMGKKEGEGFWDGQHKEPGDSEEDMCLHEGSKQHEATQARLGLRTCACFSQHLEN